MEVTVHYLGGNQFEAFARGHQVTIDQPLDNDGMDTGLTPPELFLSSLAACSGYYAAAYLNARYLPSENLAIRIRAEKGDKPARIVSINIEVIAPLLNKRHRDGILAAVEACLLTATLHHPPKITVHVESDSTADSNVLVAAG